MRTVKIRLFFCFSALLLSVAGCGKIPADKANTAVTEETTATTQTEEAIAEVSQSEEILTQEDIESDTIQWFNAAYCLLTMNNRGNPTLIGGVKKETPRLTIMLLSRDWGITDRKSADKQLNWLLSGGGHRTGYQQKIEVFKQAGVLDLNENAFLEWAETLNNTQEYNRAVTIYRTDKEYGDRGIDAWDYCRALQLLGDFYVAGYYSLQESMDASLPIAQMLQAEYTSWQDMAGSYLRGYQYWRKDDVNDPDSYSAMRQELYNLAVTLGDMGPYSIPWDLELTDTWSQAVHGEESEKTAELYVELASVNTLPEGADPASFIKLEHVSGETAGSFSYIPRQQEFLGVVDEGAYQYDIPLGLTEVQSILDEKLHTYFSDDSKIEFLNYTALSKEAADDFTGNWEEISKRIRKMAEESYGRQIYGLNFHEYLVDDHYPLYWFEFRMKKRDTVVSVAVAYRIDKGYISEYIGIGPEEEDQSQVRNGTLYMAASFHALGGPPHLTWDGENNFRGADQWDFPYLHNPFAIAKYRLGIPY